MNQKYRGMDWMDNHCPICGKEAKYCTHNVAEMLVYVCDDCEEEWTALDYPELRKNNPKAGVWWGNPYP